MKVLVVALAVLVASVAIAQPPYVLWNRTYGGNQNDFGSDVVRVNSGGCIIVGSTESYGSGESDWYILRITNDGDELWSRTIGGTGDDGAEAIEATIDSGYIISGHTTSGSYLVKIDTAGNIIWERASVGSYGYSVIQTSDGGFAFTGSYANSVHLVKTDASGYTQWSRTYGQGVGYVVRQTSDEGFLIAGEKGPYSEEDVYVVRTDSTGDTLWTRVVGGELSDIAYDMELLPGGGCIVAGTSNSYSEPYPYMPRGLLVKMDVLGDTLWLRTYGDVFIGPEYRGRALASARDGGYLVTGSYALWIDQWWSYGLVLKVDSVGNEEWLENIGCGGWLGGCGFRGIVEIGDGDFIIVGSSEEWLDSTGYNIRTIRLNEYTGVQDVGSYQPYTYKLHSPYPNPFNAVVTVGFDVLVIGEVQIRVYDVLGRKVGTLVDDVMTQGTHSARWDAGEMPSGIYFVQMEAGDFSEVKKVVLLK